MECEEPIGLRRQGRLRQDSAVLVVRIEPSPPLASPARLEGATFGLGSRRNLGRFRCEKGKSGWLCPAGVQRGVPIAVSTDLRSSKFTLPRAALGLLRLERKTASRHLEDLFEGTAPADAAHRSSDELKGHSLFR